jgi:hypothetical protein
MYRRHEYQLIEVNLQLKCLGPKFYRNSIFRLRYRRQRQQQRIMRYFLLASVY